MSLAKWKLMLTTLPLVAIVTAIKLGLERFGYQGSVEFGDVAPVFTVVAFLMGFMLAGVLADFKESEKIPGEIAAQLTTLESSLILAARKTKLDETAMRRRLMEITNSIVDFLKKIRPASVPLTLIDSFDSSLSEIDAAGGTAFVTRITGELSTLRKSILRVDVISRTSFIPAGYALLDVMVTATMLILLAAKFKNPQAEYVLVVFISFVYLYMLRLIRDIDDPFEGGGSGADVELFPITEYRERANASIGASAPADAKQIKSA